jgi:predicted nucleic acid-binding protein
MQGKVFIDTNIILYLYSEDENSKQEIALSLLDSNDEVIISSQVINEISNVLFKKYKLSSMDVENAIQEIASNIKVINYNFQTQINAIRLKGESGFQFYDALIIATALEHGCSILFTEDMQHNQIIENSLKIINPFM